MSATRDPSQKHTFVYSNLYQLYRKGKEAATNASVPTPAKAATPVADATQVTRGLATGRVIKVEEMSAGAVGLRVARHQPPSLLGKRLQPAIHANRTAPTPQAVLARRQALNGLRDNLRQLQSLHERLRFMLKEIEEFSSKE